LKPSRSIAAGLGLTLFAGFAAVSPARADTEFSAEIAANGYYADNILLSESGVGEESSLAFEINPRFQLLQESDRIRSRINYGFNYITYAESLQDAQAFHDLDAGTEWAVVPDLFYLPAYVSYTQALIDPTRPGAYGAGLLGSANLGDIAAYRVAPRLESRGSRGSYLLEYSVGGVDYEGQNNEDADDRALTAIVGLGDPEGSLAGRVGYLVEETTYDATESYEFETLFGEVGKRINPDSRLVAQVGVETDLDVSVSDGGLDETFWRGGLEWRVGRDDYLEAFVGRRFFGTTYDLRWTRTTRRYTLSVTYGEDPQTQSRFFSQRPFDTGAPTQQSAGVSGSDGFGRVTSDAYLSKELRADLALTGRLTTIRFTAAQETRSYFIDGTEDEIGEFGVSIDRRLAPEFIVSLAADLDRYEVREGETYDEIRFGIRGSRTFGSSLTGEIEISRVERSGDQQFDVNWVRVGLIKRFGGD
jgi:uncharacterized protein (PEP-CTERM system associated)